MFYSPGMTEFSFGRHEIAEICQILKTEVPKNIGDLLYSFRFRNPLPQRILDTAPSDREWVIFSEGRAKYKFKLAKINRILPNPNLVNIKILDATPEIILKHTQNDEQALLAILRYNRLIDIFLGITVYSLQNHLRTTVKKIGQIEIDEVYVGVDKHGRQFIVPVQAKGGKDQLSVVQTSQDIAFCEEKYPDLICRSVSAQFINGTEIALFDLIIDDEMIKIVDEKHYVLVGKDQLSLAELSRIKNSY
jgi:hypothetical protein